MGFRLGEQRTAHIIGSHYFAYHHQPLSFPEELPNNRTEYIFSVPHKVSDLAACLFELDGEDIMCIYSNTSRGGIWCPIIQADLTWRTHLGGPSQR